MDSLRLGELLEDNDLSFGRVGRQRRTGDLCTSLSRESVFVDGVIEVLLRLESILDSRELVGVVVTARLFDCGVRVLKCRGLLLMLLSVVGVGEGEEFLADNGE